MSSEPPEPDASGSTTADVDAAEVAEADVGEATPVWRERAGAAWHYLRWPTYAGAALLGLLVLVGIWIWTTTDLPEAAASGESAVLLDRNGDELAVLAQDGLRLEVSLDEIDQSVVDALVAAEDQRFYDHDGVDPVGIVRALWNNVRHDDLQGGSTITQQLVKNVYLNDDRTVSRKVREAVLSVKLEQTSSKDEILERYLNAVYFGRGAYGIEAAAVTYFDVPAAELAPEQSALLIGLLRAPEALDPASAADAAKDRRDDVLAAMGDIGALEPNEVEAAQSKKVEVLDEASPTTLSAGIAPHFVEKVRADLVEEFGEQALYDRGLVVHTTLDIADQTAAEAAVAKSLDDPEDPQAAVVGIDRSGAIRAWVGGRDYEELKLDLVSDEAGTGRQPGSTFKPLVLTANFEAGNGAAQQFPAPPEITLDIPPEPWTVQNAGGAGYGTLSLFEGTVNSVNTVYAQALAQVGPEAVVDVAGRMGIGRELDAQPSIALGAEEVSVLELATVYSTFSRSGERIDPYRYTKVETRDGDVLFELDEPEAERAIEANVADTVSHILSEVPKRGTATRAKLDRPMAAKTGTTQQNADAWLAGYTPEYTAIVWMGDADGNTPMDTVDGEKVFGGSIPAQIWHDFMAVALEDVEPTEFPEPDQELLGDPAGDATLDVSPARVEPGDAVTVRGSGFEACLNGWQAVINGPTGPAPTDQGDEPTGEPVDEESASDGGSTESDRSAQFTIPGNAAAGTYEVSARCDFGTGPRPYGPTATLTVAGPEPDETTTTTTEPQDKGTDKKPTTTTTTTTRPPRTTTTSTTTTTQPDETATPTTEP